MIPAFTFVLGIVVGLLLHFWLTHRQRATTLAQVQQRVETVHTTLLAVERERLTAQGELTTQLRHTAEQTGKLQETSEALRNALANTRVRGQWGERMAEDILRLVGMVEHINYEKQQRMASGNIPDYTFVLPQGLLLNMDVKFPLDNYIKYLAGKSDFDRARHQAEFRKDVRARIKETLVYIDPPRTLDYVLLFLPNDTIYGFLYEYDPMLFDEALEAKVILCSPQSLYAILAIIHQAVSAFAMERSAAKTVEAIAEFRKQWDLFAKGFDKLGQKVEETKTEFDQLLGRRRKALDRAFEELSK